MIWTTSNWANPEPVELSGMFFRTEMLLVGYSMNCAPQPLRCRFWIKSHRDVRPRPLPKSWRMERNKPHVSVCCNSKMIKGWNVLTQGGQQSLFHLCGDCAVYIKVREQVGCTSCAHQAQLGWIRRHSSQEVALPLIHMLRPEKRCESENRSRSGMVSVLRLKLEDNRLRMRTCISPVKLKKTTQALLAPQGIFGGH